MNLNRLFKIVICFFLGVFLHADFVDPHGSIVIVKTEGGQGSGFIVQEDGFNYVMTNAHVIGGTLGLEIITLNGNPIEITRMDLAKNTDIVRFLIEKMPEGGAALTHEDGEIRINEVVKVYGNSQGRNVVTEIIGKVQGVGPKEIEVSAEFVQGNSGSPILNKAGRVIGIATYVTREDSRSNWVIAGTRFAQVRRFGLRLNDVEWHTVDRSILIQQYNLLNDIQKYSWDIVDLLPYWVNYFSDDDLRIQTFDRNRRNMEKRRGALNKISAYRAKDQEESYSNMVWPNAIHKFCDLYLIATSGHWEEEMKGVNQQSNKYRVHLRNEEIRQKELTEHANKLTSVPINILEQTEWVSGYLKENAEFTLNNFKILNNLIQGIMEGPRWGSKLRPESLRNRVRRVDTIENVNL